MSDIGKEIYERYQQGYERGVADERARCIKVLEDLIVPPIPAETHGGMYEPYEENDALRRAIEAVASSPVGGEQHG